MSGYLPLRRPVVLPSVDLSWERFHHKNCHHHHDHNSINFDHTSNDHIRKDEKPRSVCRSIRLLKNSSLAAALFVTCGTIIFPPSYQQSNSPYQHSSSASSYSMIKKKYGFYRTQVSQGSDLWVRLSLTHLKALLQT